MSRFILDVNDEYGTTVVLIEHDMSVVMDISDRVVVLDYGKKIGDGTPAEVRANEDVRALGPAKHVEAAGPPRPGRPARPAPRGVVRHQGKHVNGLLPRTPDRRPDDGHAVLARRARLRAHLQGQRRVQLRPGAMVLFAALAMARFAEWIPKWLGFDSPAGSPTCFAFCRSDARSWWRWPGRSRNSSCGKLVNQEGITLLMATLGIAYFMDGFGQTFGSDIYKIDVGHAEGADLDVRRRVPGGAVNKGRPLRAALIAAALVVALTMFFGTPATRPRGAPCRRSPGGAVIGIPLNRIWVIV